MTATRPHPLRRVWPGVAAESSPRTGPVRLTFDDGPHPIYTPRVLERLARFGVRATFFAVGKCAVESPRVLREVVAAGHEVGNHTFTHRVPKLWDNLAAARDVTAAQVAIRDAAGATPTRFRPPLGRLSLALWLAARRHDMRVAMWSLDSNDWRCRGLADAEACAKSVAVAARPGDAILAHDAGPWAAALLDELLPRLADSGLL